MAGKKGDSPEKNAALHKKNPYLITLDIRNAYPSIDTQRVKKNLEAGLEKPLATWCPLLQTKEQKELFIKAIAHLCVSNNELPQWASTSNQIQNITMRKVDTKIEMKLWELWLENPVYSRYADDIALSFSNFETKGTLQKKMDWYVSDLEEHKMDRNAIKDILEKLYFEPIYFANSDEYELFGDYRRKFKEFIESNSVLSDDDRFIFDARIRTFAFCGSFGFERDIKDIKDALLKILGSEWRVLNPKKTKIRTPHSNTDRVINKIRFNAQWERTLTKKKLSEYTRLFNDLLEWSVEELASKSFYRGKFKINLNEEWYLAKARIAILYSIEGVYKRIKHIYGDEKKFPKDILILYGATKLKWENYEDREVSKTDYKGFIQRAQRKTHSPNKNRIRKPKPQEISEEEHVARLDDYFSHQKIFENAIESQRYREDFSKNLPSEEDIPPVEFSLPRDSLEMDEEYR